MRLPRRSTFVEGIMVFCLGCLFLQVWIEMSLEGRQKQKIVDFETHSIANKPTLGIVVPLVAEDMTRAVESIKRWPTTCSENTLNGVDLILYFAGKRPVELDRHLQAASHSTSCFKATRVVSALLGPEETSAQSVRNALFYNLFLAPRVRPYFVGYDALAIVDWDTIIAQETSFERLYSMTFTASEPFWVKGSHLETTYFDDGVSTGMWAPLDHLDGNAIYNNTDHDFFYFVEFTLDQWYDAALWATISDYPYSWPLWQRYASKFIATRMVSTVEVLDKDDALATGIAPDTLFLRRRAKGTGKRSNTVERETHWCHQACGTQERLEEDDYVFSTVCDSTCVNGHPWIGIRFNGHNCGAGDPSKYGESCRLCYKDQQAALDAEQTLVASSGNSWAPHDHTIMCKTKRPPEAIDCPRECEDNINTICDSRCGTGRYGDCYCNWRSLGETCRFGFHDVTVAHRADKIARDNGGRVIMCETNEPPAANVARAKGIQSLIQDGVRVGAVGPTSVIDANPDELSVDMNPASTEFIGDITRENICIFIPGYFEFFHETRLAIASIETFMPGVRVVIATHPMDYHVFHRNLHAPKAALSIVNDTRVAYAPLSADKACGNNIRLIYYMGPGEVLSRPFTAKDTHSPKGDLLVKHANAKFTSGEHARRSLGITTLLGFHGLSFTYDSDLILPAAMNEQLRAILRDAMEEPGSVKRLEDSEGDGDIGTSAFHEFLDSLSSDHIKYASIFIPEPLQHRTHAYNRGGYEVGRRNCAFTLAQGEMPSIYTLVQTFICCEALIKAYKGASSRHWWVPRQRVHKMYVGGQTGDILVSGFDDPHHAQPSPGSVRTLMPRLLRASPRSPSPDRLLAALLFQQNPVGVQFIDPRDQRRQYSTDATIWDIDLLRPRFGCSIDLSSSLQGYDVAYQLDKHFDAFRNGARCDQGFVAVDPTALKLKAEWEFPTDYPSSIRMPSLRDFRISVMYRTFSQDAELFEISLPTAIRHLPDALEIVVVVEEMDKNLFEKLLAPHRESAPFPLRIVTEPSIMNGHIQQKYSKMRADLYTEGDYILHLDSDVLVLHEVTYEDIFHLGKPVLPYRRYRDDSPEGEQLTWCWQNGTSFGIGEEVLHEFSIFNTHVYPRQMYPALRKVLEERHEKPFSDFMSTRVGMCSSTVNLAMWSAERRGRLLSDFNIMGAFLWYHMPEAVYWMAADPYDLRPDQWRVDLVRYQWVCQVSGRYLPRDHRWKAKFKADFLAVTNIEQCNSVVQS